MLLLIDSIPDLIEIIVLVVFCLAAGFAAGYFLFRMKYRRNLGIFEARETALANREKELARIRAAMKAHGAMSGDVSDSSKSTDNETRDAMITLLKEEIEQMELDISIMREEHDLEIKILQGELGSPHSKPGAVSRASYVIEDVTYSTEPASLDDAIDQTEFETGSTTGDGSTSQASDYSEPRVNNAEGEPHNTIGNKLNSDEVEETNEAVDESSASVPEDAGITTWAANFVVSLIDGVVSTVTNASQTDEKDPAAPEMSESMDNPVQTRETGTVSIPAFPRFASLGELFDFDSLQIDPDQGELPPNVEAAGLQILLGLSDEHYQTLTELGFDSYDKIALLSSREISLLAKTFEIPESTIERIWVSGAHLRLYEDAA